MYKASIELFKVHKNFKVKFCLVYNKDSDILNKNFNKTITKFNFSGNDYLKLAPYPYLSLDISSNDKYEEWSSNRSVNLNRRDLFNFICKLNKLYRQFTIHQNLFYYDENGELKVNKELSENIKEVLICTNNKGIMMQPCVVREINETEFEGILLYINSMEYYTYLTYGDIEYLLYELKRIDMMSLAMNLINTIMLMEEKETEVTIKEGPVTEEKQIEIQDIKSSIKIPKPNSIPDI